MDPALFRIDFEVVAEVLTTVIVLSFFVERALSIIFEHRLYVQIADQKGFKAPIAFLVSWLVVGQWQFDAMSILMQGDKNSTLGYLITAAIIAGGSKASIALFHNVMNARSDVSKAKAGAPT